jgi:predicted O-methyltransferase YrrM
VDKEGKMSKMIPNMEAYFRQFIPPRDDLLLRLEEEAEQEKIPIIGPVVGQLLYILVRVTQACRILELGTATGYSAIYLARGCEPAGGKVITLERDEGIAARATNNFQKAGIEKQIEVRVGDALEEMNKMDKGLDFIFMDVDKEDYLPVLDQCHKLLKSGGLLATDNVGFQGSADFNEAIAGSPQWRSVHLLSFFPLHSPERDGLCLALRV